MNSVSNELYAEIVYSTLLCLVSQILKKNQPPKLKSLGINVIQ